MPQPTYRLLGARLMFAASAGSQPVTACSLCGALVLAESDEQGRHTAFHESLPTTEKGSSHA